MTSTDFFELKEILHILKTNKRYLAGITGGIVAAALLLTLIQPAIYESKTNIVLNENVLSELLEETNTTNIKNKNEPDIYIQDFSNFIISKKYRNFLFDQFDPLRKKDPQQPIRDRRLIYTRYVELAPITIEASIQANSRKRLKEATDYFAKNIEKNYQEQATSENVLRMSIIEEEITKASKELSRLDSMLSLSDRKFKHIDMEDYIRNQEEMLRQLTIEQGINAYNVQSNPVVTKLRERVNEIEKEVANAQTLEEKAASKETLLDAKNRYSTALYLVKTKIADGANSTAYNMKISMIRQELEYLSKHDKDILLKVTLIKVGNQKLSDLLRIREQLKENKILFAISIKDIEKSKYFAEPINKRYKRVFILSFVLGILIAFVFVMVRQYFAPTVINAKAIEAIGAWFWGGYSLADKKESINLIRTKLLFSLNSNKVIIPVLNFSQAATDDFIAELALALQKIGKSVLVIDADYRAAQETAQGLTDLLEGTASTTDYANFLQKAPYPLLALGKQVNNPPDVLALSKFKELCILVKQQYDFTFILTTEQMQVADSLLVAKEADHSLMLFDPQEMDTAKIQDILQNIRSVNNHTSACVFYYK